MKEHEIIEKIRKLIALAESPNENEAAAAAKKAQDLIYKYNVDKKRINSREDKFLSEVIAYNKIPTAATFVVPVIEHIVPIIAGKMNIKPDARHFTQTPQLIFFFGKEANPRIARYYYEFLLQTYQELWGKTKKEKNLPDKLKGAYYDGLSHGLISKLLEQKRKREKNSENCTAIIKIEKELQEEAKKRFTFAPQGEHLYEDNLFVRFNGLNDGKNIQLRKGIEEKTKKVLTK